VNPTFDELTASITDLAKDSMEKMCCDWVKASVIGHCENLVTETLDGWIAGTLVNQTKLPCSVASDCIRPPEGSEVCPQLGQNASPQESDASDLRAGATTLTSNANIRTQFLTL